MVRILGKYLGAILGPTLVGEKKEVRKYLGLALVPQAGVETIGLSALGARILGGELGRALETVILASSILYELIGPGCAKLGLYLSHSYAVSLEDLTESVTLEPEKKKNEVELLIERIQAIQKELPSHAKRTRRKRKKPLPRLAEEQY